MCSSLPTERPGAMAAVGRVAVGRVAVGRVAVGALCLGAVACGDLERFDTSGDAAYCGSLTTASFVTAGLLPEGTARLQATMEIDADELDTLPGTLTTHDGADGLCSPLPLFDGAPMRAVAEVQHDTLSALEFGQGRDHNLFVWVDSTCQGTMVGVLSLLHDRDAELRLFKPMPAGAGPTPPEATAGFGVLRFERKDKGCGD